MIRQADQPYKGWRPGRLVAPPSPHGRQRVRQTYIHDFILRMIFGGCCSEMAHPRYRQTSEFQMRRYEFQTYLVVVFSIFISLSDIFIALQCLAA
jgi:hypothetical protein